MSSKALRVGILGASGLVGQQLLSILSEHSGVSTVVPFSRRLGGTVVWHNNPAFRHLGDLRYVVPDTEQLRLCDTLFLALPAGESFSYVRAVAGGNTRVIDVGSDFRFKDPARYESIYQVQHGLPDELDSFRVVVPEVNGDCLDSSTSRIALPGCTSTAVILALYPLVRAGLLGSSQVIVDAKTSSSASASKASAAQLHYQRSQGIRVHKLLRQHRHRHEIEEFLKAHCSGTVEVFLNTFAVDQVRGLSVACYVDLAAGVRNADVASAYRYCYQNTRFVRIVKLNNGFERYPNPKLNAGTNYCDIGFEVDEQSRKAVLIGALDNLLKGAAGQAVQCFNRVHLFPETTGLPMQARFP